MRELIARRCARCALPGRFQILPGPVEWILDVAHNEPAARVLAQPSGRAAGTGRTFAVAGILRDKDVAGIGARLRRRWMSGSCARSPGRAALSAASSRAVWHRERRAGRACRERCRGLRACPRASAGPGIACWCSVLFLRSDRRCSGLGYTDFFADEQRARPSYQGLPALDSRRDGSPSWTFRLKTDSRAQSFWSCCWCCRCRSFCPGPTAKSPHRRRQRSDEPPLRSYTIDLGDTRRASASDPASGRGAAGRGAARPRPQPPAASAPAAVASATAGQSAGARGTAPPVAAPAPVAVPRPAAAAPVREPAKAPRAAARACSTAGKLGGGWTVQLGTFGRANAERLVHDSRRRDLRHFRRRVAAVDVTLYRVRVGPAGGSRPAAGRSARSCVRQVTPARSSQHP